LSETQGDRFSRGCQMVYFHTKYAYLGKFSGALDWKMLVYFMANILRTFGILYDHLVHFYGFGIMHQEKSGNPGCSPVNDLNWQHK
jgi:hypothetical protein